MRSLGGGISWRKLRSSSQQQQSIRGIRPSRFSKCKLYQILCNITIQSKIRRLKIKKLSLKERLPLLHQCMPYIPENPVTMKFFKENFSQEIGAMSAAGYDYVRAEQIYNGAKRLKQDLLRSRQLKPKDHESIKEDINQRSVCNRVPYMLSWDRSVINEYN